MSGATIKVKVPFSFMAIPRRKRNHRVYTAEREVCFTLPVEDAPVVATLPDWSIQHDEKVVDLRCNEKGEFFVPDSSVPGCTFERRRPEGDPVPDAAMLEARHWIDTDFIDDAHALSEGQMPEGAVIVYDGERDFSERHEKLASYLERYVVIEDRLHRRIPEPVMVFSDVPRAGMPITDNLRRLQIKLMDAHKKGSDTFSYMNRCVGLREWWTQWRPHLLEPARLARTGEGPFVHYSIMDMVDTVAVHDLDAFSYDRAEQAAPFAGADVVERLRETVLDIRSPELFAAAMPLMGEVCDVEPGRKNAHALAEGVGAVLECLEGLSDHLDAANFLEWADRTGYVDWLERARGIGRSPDDALEAMAAM